MCMGLGTGMDRVLTQPTLHCIVFSPLGGHLRGHSIALSCMQGQETLSCFFLSHNGIKEGTFEAFFLNMVGMGRGFHAPRSPPLSPPVGVAIICDAFTYCLKINGPESINNDLKFHVILICFGFTACHPCHSHWLAACVTSSVLLKVTLVHWECLIVPRDPDATLLCVKAAFSCRDSWGDVPWTKNKHSLF